jgi:predicted lipoprotein with Yx(FWY)xxD motif
MTRNRLALPILIVTIIAIVAVITATSGATKKTATRPASSAISVRQTPVGKALVDANGRTLYLFAGDRPDSSRLSAAGQAVWPPFTSSRLPAGAGGATAGLIGTIAASKQIAYDGHPLYYYVGDRRPGQTSGQGLNQFGARWYTLTAVGNAITSLAPRGSGSQSQRSPSTAGGGSYGC